MNDAAELNDNIGGHARAVDEPGAGGKENDRYLGADPSHLDPS